MTSFAFYALKENKRKILSWLCVISMIFNMLPVTAFATEAEEAYAQPTEIAQEAASDDVKEEAPAGYNKISEDIYIRIANNGFVLYKKRPRHICAPGSYCVVVAYCHYMYLSSYS